MEEDREVRQRPPRRQIESRARDRLASPLLFLYLCRKSLSGSSVSPLCLFFLMVSFLTCFPVFHFYN